MSEVKNVRPISAIAREIEREWKKVYFGAVPYLRAMHMMYSIEDNYGLDSGESVVAYFLANAHTFRGEKARALKAELNAILKGVK